jgi:hypothetical protein
MGPVQAEQAELTAAVRRCHDFALRRRSAEDAVDELDRQQAEAKNAILCAERVASD